MIAGVEADTDYQRLAERDFLLVQVAQERAARAGGLEGLKCGMVRSIAAPEA